MKERRRAKNATLERKNDRLRKLDDKLEYQIADITHNVTDGVNHELAQIFNQFIRPATALKVRIALEEMEESEWKQDRLKQISSSYQVDRSFTDLLSSIWTSTKDLRDPAKITEFLKSIWNKIYAFVSFVPTFVSGSFSLASKMLKALLSTNFYKFLMVGVLYIILRYFGLTNVANILLGIFLSFEDSSYLKFSGIFLVALGFTKMKVEADEAIYGPKMRMFHSGSVQLQGDELHPSPASSLATIAMMLGTLIFSLKIGDYLPHDYEVFAKRMNAHCQVAKGFSTIHDSFTYLLSGIKETGYSFLGLDPDGADAMPVDIRENIKILTKYDADMKAQLHTRPDHIREIIEGHDEYLRLRILYSQNRSLSPMLDKMQIGWVNLNSIAQAHNHEPAGCRIVPTVLMLRGESGVGKSSVMYHIASYVLAEGRVIDEDSTDEEIRKKVQTCVYPRASETTYWEGYKRQPITMVDDAFQLRDSVSSPNLDVMELIRMSNPFPMPLNMAHLHAKGNSNFDSRVIVYTTNVRRLKFESVISDEAIQNRVSMPYEVKIKAQYANRAGKLLDEHKTGVINTDVYEFFKWNTANGSLAQTSISFEQLVDELLVRMRRSKNNATMQSNDLVSHSRAAIAKVSTFNGDALLPEPQYGPIPILDERFDEMRFPPRGIPSRRGRRWYQMESGNSRPSTSRDLADDGIRWDHIYDRSELEDIGFEADSLQTPRSGWKRWLPSFLFKPLELSKSSAMLNTRAAWHCTRGLIPPLYKHYWKFAEANGLMEDGALAEGKNYLDLKRLFDENAELLAEPLKQRLTNDMHTMKELQDMVAERTGMNKEVLDLAAAVIFTLSVVAGSFAAVALFSPESSDNEWWKQISVIESYPLADEIRKDLEECEKDHLKDGYVSGPRWMRIMAYLEWCKEGNHACFESEDIDMSKQIEAMKGKMKYVPDEGIFESGKARKYEPKTTLESGKERKFDPKVKMEGDPEYQGWTNPNSRDIATCIRKNVVRLVPIINGIEVPTRINALFLANRDLLFNRHYLERFEMYASTGELEISVRAVGSTTGVTYSFEEFKETAKEIKRGALDMDLMVTRLDRRTGNRYPSILKYIVTKDQVSNIVGRRAVLNVSGREGWEMNFGKVLKAESMTVQGKSYASTYTIDISSVDGDCGGYYIFDDAHSSRKLFGIHFAGFAGGACAMPLVYEDLENVIDQTPVYAMDVEDEDTPAMLVGNCLVRGKADRGLTVPSKSSLVQTKIFNEIIETEMMPAAISYDEREGGILAKALSKQFREQPTIDAGTLNRAVASYERMLSKTDNSRDMRKLTYEEAVAGVVNDDYIRGIERSTSAGWPACLDTKRGKTEWFGSDGEYTLDSPKSQELKSKIENDIRKMEDGGIVRYTFMNVLKDETRPIEKVMAGKTRVFSACPIDFLVVFRMYFMSFLALMMENRIHNESAVGIKAQSLEWTELAKHLKSVGNRMIAGDFSNYDGTLHSKILWKVYDIIESYYKTSSDYNPNDSLVRAALWENIVSSESIVNNHIYQLNHSQPSGNPSTAILNSMYNSIACRYVYYAAGHLNFNRYVRMQAYGDDNLLSVHPDVEWSQEDMTREFLKIGMIYTDEDKNGAVDYRPLEEVSFLKRGFSQPFLGAQFAPLKIRSILECFNWIHKTTNERGVMEQNWEMANLELSFHPADVFDKWTHSIRTALAKQYGYRPPIKPRTAYLSAIRDGDQSLFDQAQWV